MYDLKFAFLLFIVIYPSSVTFRNRGVTETEFIHQANEKKIDSLQQSIDENQVVKNG